eukprot:12909662-Prorocentrum_lima.AAC.1
MKECIEERGRCGMSDPVAPAGADRGGASPPVAGVTEHLRSSILGRAPHATGGRCYGSSLFRHSCLG